MSMLKICSLVTQNLGCVLCTSASYTRDGTVHSPAHSRTEPPVYTRACQAAPFHSQWDLRSFQGTAHSMAPFRAACKCWVREECKWSHSVVRVIALWLTPSDPCPRYVAQIFGARRFDHVCSDCTHNICTSSQCSRRGINCLWIYDITSAGYGIPDLTLVWVILEHILKHRSSPFQSAFLCLCSENVLWSSRTPQVGAHKYKEPRQEEETVVLIPSYSDKSRAGNHHLQVVGIR